MQNKVNDTTLSLTRQKQEPEIFGPELKQVTRHPEPAAFTGQEDFRFLADSYGLTYQIISPYLYVAGGSKAERPVTKAEIPDSQAETPVTKAETPVSQWILHISVIPTQLPGLLKKLLPILIEEKVTFKIPENLLSAVNLLSADYGYELLGKIISIYPTSDRQADRLAKRLISETQDMTGPVIPTDILLGGALYTRYGIPSGIPAKTGSAQSGTQQTLREIPAIPFVYPRGVHWPFTTVKRPRKTRKKALILHHRYLVTQLLKADVKGNVLQCIDLKNWWRFQFRWCLAKEGKKNMSYDDSGRDIHDRLEWQRQLQTDLQGIIPVPEVYDFFKENGNTYIVMQLIEGQHLHGFQDTQFGGQSWFALKPQNQLALLDYLLQIIDYADILHNKGFIHRDLTPANFMIDQKGKLFLIDMELCYSGQAFGDRPPFTYGSPGFMSPEQMAVTTPTEKEDIYALGALIITFITGLPPSRFDVLHPLALQEQLSYFTRHRELSILISLCLQQNSVSRPALSTIRTFIRRYRQEVINGTHLQWDAYPLNDHRAKVKEVIRQNILALQAGKLAGKDGLWYSPIIQVTKQVGNPSSATTIREGFYSGINGVLYTVAQLHSAGFVTSKINKEIQANWSRLQQYLAEDSQDAGLYNGTAGFAITLAAGIQSGKIIRNEQTIQTLHQLFRVDQPDHKNNDPRGHVMELTISSGLAGIGLAVLNCQTLLDPAFAQALLHYCAESILQHQQKDGSWIFTHQDYPGKKIKFPGYSHGLAGIVSFLLDYYRYLEHLNPTAEKERIRSAAVKALDWLTGQARESSVELTAGPVTITANPEKVPEVDFSAEVNSSAPTTGDTQSQQQQQPTQPTLQWTLHSKSMLIDPSLDIGVTGIAWVFIKAYEILGEEKYKVIAEKTLWDHPKYIQLHNYNLAQGMAGIGMVYLQAHRVLGGQQWQKRADHIAGVLLHSFNRYEDQKGISWFTVTASFPTADFLSGNTGISYFLLHYLHPELLKKSFPF